MRVAGAVARFGPAAVPTVVALLKSPDGEKRKLGVAILSENALPIAAHLLKSRNCEDRKSGIAIFADMWLVMAKDHLAKLKEFARLPCQLMVTRNGSSLLGRFVQGSTIVFPH